MNIKRGERMTREEAIAYGKRVINLGLNDETQAFCDMAIKALEQQDKILQILDDYELEAWEILEMIKEVVRV